MICMLEGKYTSDILDAYDLRRRSCMSIVDAALSQSSISGMITDIDFTSCLSCSSTIWVEIGFDADGLLVIS
jgi:hypothetical protein